MGKFFALFSGVSPWVYLTLSVLLLAAGGTAGYKARGLIDAPVISNAKAETSQCHADHETARANSNQASLDALNADIAALNGVAADIAAKQAARATADHNFIKELSNAPKTSLCGGSDAERAYRNSVVGVRVPAVAP